MSLAEKKGSDAQRLDRSAFDVANRAFFRLYQASNLLHKVGTRYVSDFSATTQQWAVMGALARPFARGRGMTVKDLIEFLMVTRQNITPLLDRLEERGWVERVKDPEDGRSRRLRLTPQGTSAWQDMQTPIDAFYADALDAFSDQERLQLYRLLDKLKDRMSEM